MTSEKAVEVLRKIKAYANGDDREALDMAIESLIYDYTNGIAKGLEIAISVLGTERTRKEH